MKIKNKGLIVNGRAQTLVETVVALAVVIILVSSLVSLSIASLRSATLSRNQAAAGILAHQELERLRQARDVLYLGSFSAFSDIFSGFCVGSTAKCRMVASGNSWDLASGTSTVTVSGTEFAVSLNGTTPAADRISVTANVSWNDSLGAHNQPIQSVLSNWR